MKSRYFLIASIAAVVAAIFILSGCAGLISEEIDLGNEPTTYYTVTYMDGNTIVATKEVAANSLAEDVVLQDRLGYDFVCWKLNGIKYNFSTPVTRNIVLNAQWDDAKYTVTFVADGKTVSAVKYTSQDDSISEPAVPLKNGYTGEWAEYNLNGDLTVTAVYTPVEYSVRFFDGTTLLHTLKYTVENTDITVPAVPTKQGKTGRWSAYTLSGGDINVYAVYEFIKYTVTFVADGVSVNVCEYDQETQALTVPQVPLKTGYIGSWEEFSLNFENVTVNAVYVPAPESFTTDDGLIFKRTNGAYGVTGYTGNSSGVIVPDFLFGLPVTEIAADAFSCAELTDVTLSENLEKIGANAFEGCAFTEITLPETLREIESYAFYRCAYLTRIEIPDGAEVIGAMAFGGCVSLQAAVIGSGVKVIERLVFVNCASLKQVTFRRHGEWLVCSNPAGVGGVSVILDSDEYSLYIIRKFYDKYLIRV